MNQVLKSALSSALLFLSLGATVAHAQDFAKEATPEDIRRIEAMKLNPVTEAAAKTFAGAFRYSERVTGKPHPDLQEPMPTGLDDREYKEYRLEMMRLKREQKQAEIDAWRQKNNLSPNTTVANRVVSRTEGLARAANAIEPDPVKQAELYEKMEQAAIEDHENRMLDLSEDVSGEPIDSDEYVPMNSLFGKGHYPKATYQETDKKAKKSREALIKARKEKAEKLAKEKAKAEEQRIAQEKAAKAKQERQEQQRAKELDRLKKKQAREIQKEKQRKARRKKLEERRARKLLEENGIDPEELKAMQAKAKKEVQATPEPKDKMLGVKEVFKKTETEEIKNEVWDPAEVLNRAIEADQPTVEPSTPPSTEEGSENKGVITPLSFKMLNLVQNAFAATARESDLSDIRNQAYELGREIQERDDSISEEERLKALGIETPKLDAYTKLIENDLVKKKPVASEPQEVEASEDETYAQYMEDKPIYLTTFFVSESMGKDKVAELIDAYAGDNTVRFVVKGFNGKGTINQGLKWILDLILPMQNPPNLTIDPELFQKYEVKLAPTMLIERMEQPKQRKGEPIPKDIIRTLTNIAKANGMDIDDAVKQVIVESRTPKPIRYPELLVTGVTSRDWALAKITEEDRDFNQGVQGEAHPVVERDIEEVAKERLANIDWEQKKEAALNRFWSNQEKNYIALPSAMEDKERIVDPSIVLNRDVYGADGRVVFKKGSIFNPFDAMPFTKTMIVFNAAKKHQVAKVDELIKEERKNNRQVLLLVTEFAPDKALDQIRSMNDNWKESVFLLTPEIKQRFQIRVTPTVVRADNEKKVFHVKEIDLETGEGESDLACPIDGKGC